MQRLSAASIYDSDLGIGLGTPMDTASVCSSHTSDSGVSVGGTAGAAGQIPGLRRMQFPRPVQVRHQHHQHHQHQHPAALTETAAPAGAAAAALARPRTLQPQPPQQHRQSPQLPQQQQQQQLQKQHPTPSASGRSTPLYAVPTAPQLRSLPPPPQSPLPPTPPPSAQLAPPPPPPAYNASHAWLTSQDCTATVAATAAAHLARAASGLGACGKCTKMITSPSEACHALDKVFHSACFTCQCCGRELSGQVFYAVPSPSDPDGSPPSVYCAQDFLYTGFQQAAEKCAVCGHLITDQILKALGRPFHPACFRCSVCHGCLDGKPFTVDVAGAVFCLPDYHRVYAPRCCSCGLPIAPESDGAGEILRIVSMGRDFHLDCYRCQDCGLQLSNESHKRCYPVVDKASDAVHLYCYSCRVRRSN